MPLNLSPLCNFLPKKFNTLKTYFYKVSVPFLVHYSTCYINKLSDRLFNYFAWRKKGNKRNTNCALKTFLQRLSLSPSTSIKIFSNSISISA